MVDEPGGVGILEEVEELVVDVAVVHVEGRDARAVGAKHRLEVLGRVEETESHVVLARLVVLERGPLDPAPEAVRVEHARQPAGVLRQATVGQASRRGDDRLAVGVGRGERLEDEREVHAGQRSKKPWCGARARARV